MTQPALFPRFRAVADQAVLVEFGDVISEPAHSQVMSLDTKLAQTPFHGFVEAVPAYVSLLVCFDALCTDHAAVKTAVKALLDTPALLPNKGRIREVDVCYEEEFCPDMMAVSEQTGLSADAIIGAHLGATYRVVMYGFAPGYAYLGGLPAALHIPRKPSAKRGVAAGSVIIAGGQCLIATLTMPTGWWIIGRSPTRILRDSSAKPFLFDVSDEVRFTRIDRATFDAKSTAQ
jgi:inhibitor of KinA